MPLASFFKKPPQERPAFFPQNAGGDLYPVIQAVVFKQAEERTDGSSLRVFGTVDQARDPGLDNGPRAHGAGLYRYVQRAPRKAVVAAPGGPFPQGLNFRMRRRVRKGNGPIPSPAQNLPCVHQDRSYGDLSFLEGPDCFLEGKPHEYFIFRPVFRVRSRGEPFCAVLYCGQTQSGSLPRPREDQGCPGAPKENHSLLRKPWSGPPAEGNILLSLFNFPYFVKEERREKLLTSVFPWAILINTNPRRKGKLCRYG
jgi:hypothetical protein